MGKNRSRAEALVEDMKAYNPKMYRQYKKEGTNPVDAAEKFLDHVLAMQEETFQHLKSQIPKNLPPLEVAQRENEMRMRAQEMANQDIMDWIR